MPRRPDHQLDALDRCLNEAYGALSKAVQAPTSRWTPKPAGIRSFGIG